MRYHNILSITILNTTMAQLPPTQQPNDGPQLIKPSMHSPHYQFTHSTLTLPADWPHYMADAARLFTSDDKMSTNYKDSDDARMAILNTLNWFEAHAEYKWPDFARVRLDFSQIMRFRRALVSDVFVSLQRAGKVRISRGEGGLGTPNSVAERVGKRKSGAGKYHKNERKFLADGTDN